MTDLCPTMPLDKQRQWRMVPVNRNSADALDGPEQSWGDESKGDTGNIRSKAQQKEQKKAQKKLQKKELKKAKKTQNK